MPMKISHKRPERHSDQDIEESNHELRSPTRKKVRWEQSMQTTDVPGDVSESEEEELTADKTCLATWCKQGRIGCAYYDTAKSVLYLLEDTEESPHYDVTTMLLEQLNPGIVLTSSRADDGFMDLLREHMENAGGIFQIRPHKDFVPSKGRDRLLSLRILMDLPERGPEGDLSYELSHMKKTAYNFMQTYHKRDGDPTIQRWNASIRSCNFAPLESAPLCMASIGALLDHIVRQRAVGDLDDLGIGGLDVRDIEILSFDQVMHINSDALYSLQIFWNESHASVYSDKTKEGLSLFGTLNTTQTSLGRSLLRNWLLRPSLSLAVIKERHDAVECFLRSENISTAATMHNHLKGIKNIPRILNSLRSGNARLTDWQSLVKFTFHSAMLRENVAELHQAADVNVVEKLLSALDIANFKEIGRKVNETIDWEESSNVARVCVRPHVDEELDNRKHVYHGMDSVLSKVAEQISERVPHDYASSLNVVYFPQLGFLICVPMPKEWQMGAEIEAIEGWSFQFFSNAHVYFKSQEMHDMDVHIGDLHSLIVDREIEIVQCLLDEILVYEKAIVHSCHVCAELDCLLSFAEASQKNGYQRPKMVDEDVIIIRQGRHPLHEQIIDTFVANDTSLAGSEGLGATSRDAGDDQEAQFNRVLLCTGANACGKSVYLKQIAVIQFMAQGCRLLSFVPAESALLGIVDKSVFTRITTRESVSRVQSAFMIDLNQVSLALRNCTSRSLIVLDEFGKGTLATDGAGLFCGVIKHLLSRGPECPKVLVATHFHNLFCADLLDPRIIPVTFCHMKVLFTASDGSYVHAAESTDAEITDGSSSERGSKPNLVGQKLTYLYKVAEGLSHESHAAKCAEMFGIPSRLVQRAQHVSRLVSAHELGRLADEAMTEKERLDLEDAEAVCRRFLSWDLGAEEQEADAKTMLARCLGRGAAADQVENPGINVGSKV